MSNQLQSKLQEEFIETFDGLEISSATMRVPDPKAIAIIVHGFGEHKGAYQEMMLQCYSEDILAFAYDLRGHGGSDGRRGDFGDIADLIDDLDLVMARLESKFPDLPVTLFGHNLGAIVAARYCQENKKKIAALCLYNIPWHWQSTSTQRSIRPFLRMIGSVSHSFKQAVAKQVGPEASEHTLSLLQLIDIEKARLRMAKDAFHLLMPIAVGSSGHSTDCDEELLEGVCSFQKKLLAPVKAVNPGDVFKEGLLWIGELDRQGLLETRQELFEELNATDNPLFV